jgi:flagellar basal-body rod protein FlgC
MGLFDAIGIAGSGLSAERVRMDVTAENLANADTTKAANGQPYQRQEVVLQQAGTEGFDGALQQASAAQQPGGVKVSQIVSDTTPDQQVYDPGNPEADAQGYVKLPNVNPMLEAIDMRNAQRAYQANLSVIETAREMDNATLSIIKK